MMTFCFINAASRSPPVKQRAVRKHDNSGRSRPLYLESKELPSGSFHALKAPESPTEVSEACKYNYCCVINRLVIATGVTEYTVLL